MSENRFFLGAAIEMSKRAEQAQEFFTALFEPDERPFFVSDSATIHDIYMDDLGIVFEKCLKYYGIRLSEHMFSKPIWQVLDFLEANRSIK
ncbi:hypothetical protein [Gloeobacter violaceus]|uniref:Gsl0210 protein n=1 Tax=Gloeobacter violaceus (strain ATCC 29082 / PCC 7421) TaxID=251221 RepID=Q7NP48_GLOVI|nr:hypothetical protein [Gloeobacter violaceus]BAC88151.1 gsl0210 [Gloeobacter violaceus PCC 7421]